MARTIMVSNELYKNLKRIKKDKSFTVVISNLLHEKEKLGKDLFRFFGALEGETEYDEVMRDLNKMWTAWSKKYA
ncbi:MAG TPA: antitoxin VapB family protein [Candidatus Nanoarchaeia archaeon]|nr:antitoxin VapB family protein [Candidatus Nanoarchaeia archaeon]